MRRSLSRHARTKTLLALLLTVGAIGSIGVSGTYAVLSGEETNAGSTIASGTLTLDNKVNGGTACSSFGSGSSNNVNGGCTALVPSTPLRYPGDTVTAQVEIKDTGSLGASALSLFMPTCTASVSSGGTAFANGGNPCASITENAVGVGLQLTVQETSSAWTPTKCWYPVQAAGTCTASPNSLGIFASAFTSTSLSLNLSPGPAAGASRYFTIGVTLPTNASDTLQAEQASFDLTWQAST